MAVSERVPGRHDRLGVGYQETRQIAQRPPGAAAAVLAAAEALPFGKHRFDAAMALWTIHHWADPGKGVAELRRVARRVVIVAASERLNQLWLIRDYFPAIAFRRPEIQPGQLVLQG